MRRKIIEILSVFLLIALWAAPLKAQTNEADIGALLEEVRSQYELPALAAAVVRADGTIAEGAVGFRVKGQPARVTLGDRFHLGSTAKSMTATMIATLVEEGKLSWQTTLAQVFTEMGDKLHPSLRAVTLEQLLTHRGGITPFEDEEEPTWKQLPKLKGSPTKVRLAFTEWMLKRGAASPVGEYVYSNAGYCLAAAMAERVTGKSWEALMRERLFKPLGLKSAGFGWPARAHANEPWGHKETEAGVLVPHSPRDVYQLPPYIAPAGDVHMSITDFARYARLHLAGLNGRPMLLKASTFQKLHQPVGEYAFGWNAQVIKGLPASTHSGSAGTFYAGILIYPQKNIAIVIFINVANQKENEARNKLFGILLRKYGAIS